MNKRQPSYNARREQNRMDSPTAPEVATIYGIKGNAVDFDKPRISPYSDKKADPFFPQRPPPARPSDPSRTQRRADSLIRKPGKQGRLTGRSLSGDGSSESVNKIADASSNSSAPSGIASMLAEMGTGLSAVGKPRMGTNSSSPEKGIQQGMYSPIIVDFIRAIVGSSASF